MLAKAKPILICAAVVVGVLVAISKLAPESLKSLVRI